MIDIFWIRVFRVALWGIAEPIVSVREDVAKDEE